MRQFTVAEDIRSALKDYKDFAVPSPGGINSN